MGSVPFIVFCNETSSVGLDRLSWSWVQEEPSSLRLEQEGGRGSPDFFIRPSYILFVRTEGLFAEPILVSARLQEEPLASAWSERAIGSSPGFLYAPRA